MNFMVKPYDPVEEAIQRFQKFNQDPNDSDFNEAELTRLAVAAIRRHDE